MSAAIIKANQAAYGERCLPYRRAVFRPPQVVKGRRLGESAAGTTFRTRRGKGSRRNPDLPAREIQYDPGPIHRARARGVDHHEVSVPDMTREPIRTKGWP